MVFWLITFEILTFIFFIILLILELKAKNYRALSTILAGGIFGVLLEYFSILLTKEYHYNQAFIFQLGKAPSNVPIMIGLAWGILLETSHKITKCYKFPILLRAIFAATFVVSVDLFSDIIAVRLDGGFWIWTGRPLVYAITNTVFMGIPYSNFYGWFFVIFVCSLILHIFDVKYDQDKFSILFIRTLTGIIGSVILLMPLLFLTYVFKNWIWFMFLFIYIGSICILIIYSMKHKIPPVNSLPNYFTLVYYIYLYLFNVISMISLGMVQTIPLYFALSVLYTIGVAVFLFKLTTLKKNTEKIPK